MKKLLLVSAIVAFAGVSQAQEIGPAGCGLGNLVFGKESQVLASTTNGTFGSQTFGITTGTSNCVGGDKMAALNNYIEVNKIALSNDVARGEGDTIVGLSKIMGCSDSAVLGSALKSEYSELFTRPNVSTGELANGVEGAVLRNESLRNTCGA